MFRNRLPGHRLREENRRLRADLERLTRERDAARLAIAPPPAAADRLEFLFVVTYGRSGSTLLMGLLDALPGYCIRGENQGVVYDLFKYQTKAVAARATHGKERALRPQDAWYGIDDYPDEVAAARMRQLVLDTLLRPEPGTRVAGFKEIRWWMPQPVEYLDFIETVFPGARFILNTRNLDDVAQSSWHRNRPNARTDLEAIEERLKDTVARRGDHGYHIHFDDYVRDPSMLKGLYEWLGEEYDPDRVAEVLARRHSTSRRWKAGQR